MSGLWLHFPAGALALFSALCWLLFRPASLVVEKWYSATKPRTFTRHPDQPPIPRKKKKMTWASHWLDGLRSHVRCWANHSVAGGGPLWLLLPCPQGRRPAKLERGGLEGGTEWDLTDMKLSRFKILFCLVIWHRSCNAALFCFFCYKLVICSVKTLNNYASQVCNT